jgi:hypothetical protein
VNLLVALAVIAVAAAMFIFSYSGVHSIAELGGVSPRLARYYPGLFDAVLVIACVAAVVLRDGPWWARLWAWLVTIVVLAAIGATDVLYATNYTLRHRPTEGIVAAAPVVAVLLAFSLLLTMLRRSRAQGQAGTPGQSRRQARAVASGRRPSRAALQAAQQQTIPVPVPVDVPVFPAAISPAGAATVETPAVTAGTPVGPPPPVALPPALQGLPAAPEALPPEALPTAPETLPATPEAMSAPEDGPAPDVTPTRADPVLPVAPVAPGVTGEATLQAPYPATEPEEAITPLTLSPVAPSAEAPSPEAPSPEGLSLETPSPEAEPVPEAASARVPQGIRYAGSGPQARPGNFGPAGPGAVPAAGGADPADVSEDYWESEEAGQFAGLVYAAREEPADLDDPAGDEDTGDEDDTDIGGSAPRREIPEIDDDAPPFATAPFASVPRLNRVRSMPIPPADEDE